MKKLFPAIFLVLLPFFFVGCTTTHVQWDAVQMREGVVDYYNDEIMDNLIRAVNGQPFVHVDVAGLQAVATSKLAGSVGGGETRTRTNGTSPAMTAAGVVATFSHMLTKPFTVSVNPERDDNLTISSAPVIGALPPPGRGETQAPNIYQLYAKFLNLDEKNTDLSDSVGDFSYLSDGCSSVRTACTIDERLRLRCHASNIDEQNSKGYTYYVPGTLKNRGTCWYYVPSFYQKQYLGLFKEILTAKRPASAPPPGPVPTYTL